MEEYILEPTDKTPGIHLKDGLISISGRAISEDPHKFFRRAQQWVSEYIRKPARHTEINLQIEYSDTGSTNSIYTMLTKLVKCRNSNYNIQMVFNWIFEQDDEEIIELGKFLESELNVMFNYVERSK